MPRVAGKLTLVQVSTMSGQVNIFDVQTTPALMVMGGIKKLLESNIVKVSATTCYSSHLVWKVVGFKHSC
jgi:hypothetical protein